MSSLVNRFWQHVDTRVSSKPQKHKELRRELARLNRRRNKNTYTNWFKDPRPDVRLSDLEDLATALQVEPEVLVARPVSTRPESAMQLELPFGPDCQLSFEMQATDSSVTVKISRSR